MITVGWNTAVKVSSIKAIIKTTRHHAAVVKGCSDFHRKWGTVDLHHPGSHLLGTEYSWIAQRGCCSERWEASGVSVVGTHDALWIAAFVAEFVVAVEFAGVVAVEFAVAVEFVAAVVDAEPSG